MNVADKANETLVTVFELVTETLFKDLIKEKDMIKRIKILDRIDALNLLKKQLKIIMDDLYESEQ